MRFTYLELNNYIGIYNGMGLYTISIDFSKAYHRICIIKGTNGSGKTTIQNALSLFPDGNESFIPDRSASKIIRVRTNSDEFEIKFYHDIRTSGVRIPTKAYIAKRDPNGNFIEMNPSGNVTAYKDILYSEFRLDSNFFALTKLSMDDRGIGYKRPSDRKKFVNSIIESLDVYNDIYKLITKKTSSVKAIMANITSRLGSIGDKDSLTALIQSIEEEIKFLNDQRDAVNSEISNIYARIENTDPDNSIQDLNKETIKSLAKVTAFLKRALSEYHTENKLFIPEVESKILGDNLERCYKQIAEFNSQLDRMRTVSKSIIEQISTVRNQLDLIVAQLESMKSDEYIQTEKELEKAKAEADRLAEIISVTGIDPMAFTMNEYVLALETVHDIVSMVDQFRFAFDYNTINTCITDFAALGYSSMPSIKTYDEEQKLIDRKDEIIASYNMQIAEATADLKTAEILKNRPTSCSIDDCYFISTALKAASTNPEERLARLNLEYETFKQALSNAYDTKNRCDTYNSCINSIRTILRSIDKNGAILSRLPNGGIFTSKQEFFESLAGGQSFEYIDKLYQYIDMANYFEQYQSNMQVIAIYTERLRSLSSKKESIAKFEEMRQSLCRELDVFEIRLRANKCIINDLNKAISTAESYAKHLNDVVIPRCDQIIQAFNERDEYVARLESIKSQIVSINSLVDRSLELKAKLSSIDSQIAYKQKDRDNTLYKIRQIEDYEKSLAAYKEECDRYEKIKFYSSPTTGIQLVFMQLYMGKIIGLANDLLSYLFGGQYQLQPFIINEDEFRIPCMGNGYLNDDISSMSSSQLTMISMILSFSLLAASSTEYNVIKLDEIDDPLDEPNRAAFALLLDNIMDVMHTEQCIIISHSSEMITSNADIILLRSDGLISVDDRSNIIWNFTDV